MNFFKAIGILIMWVYDMIMLPFVLLVKLIKAVWFIFFVIIVSLIVWLLVFA